MMTEIICDSPQSLLQNPRILPQIRPWLLPSTFFRIYFVKILQFDNIKSMLLTSLRHAVEEWLRHYAINWQIAGSIPDGVTGIFQ